MSDLGLSKWDPLDFMLDCFRHALHSMLVSAGLDNLDGICSEGINLDRVCNYHMTLSSYLIRGFMYDMMDCVDCLGNVGMFLLLV